MLKIILDLFGLLILFIILIYLIPTSKKSISQLYKGNASDLDILKNFLSLPLKKITFKKVKWEYLITGNGNETIIFFHDMGGAYHFWYRQIAALRKNYRILTFTYPPINNLKDKIEGVLHIMETENINKAHLIGTSLGGYVAQFMATHYPNKVLSLALGNTFPPNKVIAAKNKVSYRIVPFLPEWIFWIFYRRTVNRKVVFSGENNEELRALLLEPTYQGMNKAQFIARYKCVIDYFVTGDMEKLNIPVQIIESDNDPMVSKELREDLKLKYPQATIFTFNNKGHYPFINEHESYTKIYQSFLKSFNTSKNDNFKPADKEISS